MPRASGKRGQTRKRVRFPYSIAIPTWNAPSHVKQTTLALLASYNVPLSAITVFVPDTEALKRFKEALPHVECRATNASTEAAMYNTISDAYPVDTPLVVCSDGLQGLLHVASPLKSFLALCDLGFSVCRKESARLWTLAPPKQQSKTITTDLRESSPALWGCFNPAGRRLTLPDCCHYERTILFWKADHAVIRLGMIVPLSLSETRCSPEGKQALVAAYPEEVELVKRRRGLGLRFRLRS